MPTAYVLVRRYVFECPTCGVIFKSREYWLFNPDPTEVRTETVHVWPLVCSSPAQRSMLLLAFFVHYSQVYSTLYTLVLPGNRRLIAELLVHACIYSYL